MNQFIINEEQILEINKISFRNAGARISQILNNLPQLKEEETHEEINE